MTIGLKRQVSLALLPIDDFTDRIITGSQLHVYTEGENISSIRKPDGYHIFCDLSGSEAEICLEGPLYQKQIIKFPIEQGGSTIYQVRMLPGAGYPLPQGATVVEGTLPPGSTIRLFLSGQKRSCKLVHDYDPDIQREELALFRPHEMSLEGKILCIRGKENDMEFSRVTDQKGNICTLKRPLSKPYQKAETCVYPVYQATAGEDGSFYLPIRSLSAREKGICILMRPDGEEKICEITLTGGKENRITEAVWKEES